MSIINNLQIALIELEDRFIYHPAIRNIFGAIARTRDAFTRKQSAQDIAHSIKLLTTAQRMTGNVELIAKLDRVINERLDGINLHKLDWSQLSPIKITPHIPRAVFLKPYKGPNEPGIMFLAFEYEWINFMCYADIEHFSSRYTLIVAPTSSPFNLANYALPRIFERPLFSLINHPEDIELIPMIGPNYRVIPLYTSHWVNPNVYQPLPSNERQVDIIMIAAWGKVKRHHQLLRALRDMPKSIKVLLIGQDQDGRTVETIIKDAQYYGVADRFETLSNANHSIVVQKLANSKVSLLLSRREGSAVVIPESLFADTPAALYRDAYNGSSSFINQETGMLLDHQNLASQLTNFLENHKNYHARAWAEANITCYRSTEKMNTILRQHAAKMGQDWTQDIFTLAWQPDPVLLENKDYEDTQADRQWMMDRFGLKIC